VSPRLPDGDPAPGDGALPADALDGLGARPFGVYVHVPFCASVCGYCDYNTYVPGAGVTRDGFVDAVLAEWALAGRVLGGAPPADTVFVGGGTPTLLPDAELARLLDAIPRAAGAEVTIEANPDTLDPQRIRALRAAGATRLSIGMQSAAPRVLATLERTHTPGRAVAVAREAREAGFAHVSLDLIFGTPGERDADWEASLAAVAEAEVDHVSTYALTVEPGTRLHAHVRSGRLPAPDDDVAARRYRRADAALAAAGLQWYEVANWAATDAARCAHNAGYWRSHDWWGLGPGRPLARRRRPLVERAAPGALRAQPRGRRLPGRGARAADARAAPDGAHDARDPAGRGPARRRPAALGPRRAARPGCAAPRGCAPHARRPAPRRSRGPPAARSSGQIAVNRRSAFTVMV